MLDVPAGRRAGGRGGDGFFFFTKHKRLEAGYEPTKRSTRHSGDVPAPDPHALKVVSGGHAWRVCVLETVVVPVVCGGVVVTLLLVSSEKSTVKL